MLRRYACIQSIYRCGMENNERDSLRSMRRNRSRRKSLQVNKDNIFHTLPLKILIVELHPYIYFWPKTLKLSFWQRHACIHISLHNNSHELMEEIKDKRQRHSLFFARREYMIDKRTFLADNLQDDSSYDHLGQFFQLLQLYSRKMASDLQWRRQQSWTIAILFWRVLNCTIEYVQSL